SADAIEPSPNTVIPNCNAPRRPKRSPRLPAVSNKPANTSVYESTIHCSWLFDAPRPTGLAFSSVGTATLRIELSTTITSRLRQSTARIHQRRWYARLVRSKGARAAGREVMGAPRRAAGVKTKRDGIVSRRQALSTRDAFPFVYPGCLFPFVSPECPPSDPAGRQPERDRDDRERHVDDDEAGRLMLAGHDDDAGDPHVEGPRTKGDQQPGGTTRHACTLPTGACPPPTSGRRVRRPRGNGRARRPTRS